MQLLQIWLLMSKGLNELLRKPDVGVSVWGEELTVWTELSCAICPNH